MNPTSQQILVCKNMKAYSIKKIMNKKVTLSSKRCHIPPKNRNSPILISFQYYCELFLIRKSLKT